MMKKNIFALLFFPFCTRGTEMVPREPQTINSTLQELANSLDTEAQDTLKFQTQENANWFREQFSRKHCQARLALRNNWGNVIEKTIEKLREDDNAERPYYEYFVREREKFVRRELSRQDTSRLLSELEANNIDCTVENIQEKISDELAQKIKSQTNAEYENWAQDFKREVDEECEKEFGKGVFGHFFGLFTDFGMDIKTEGLRDTFTREDVAKKVLRKRAYEANRGWGSYPCWFLGRLADSAKFTCECCFVPLYTWWTGETYERTCGLENAAINEQGFLNKTISGLFSTAMLVSVGALVAFLASSGFLVPIVRCVVAAFTDILGGSAAMLGSLGGLLAVAGGAGGAAYYLAKYFGIGPQGSLLIAFAAVLLSGACFLSYKKQTMEKKDWEKFSKGLLGMGTPILVLFCLVAPFGATYLVHYVLFSKVGLTKNVCYSVSGLSCLGLSFCSFLGLKKIKEGSEEVLKEREGLLEKLGFKSNKEKKEKKDKKIVNKARAVLATIFLLPLALFVLNRESAPPVPNPLREPSPSLSDDSRAIETRFRRLSNANFQVPEVDESEEEESNAAQQQATVQGQNNAVQTQETLNLAELIDTIKNGSWRYQDIAFSEYCIERNRSLHAGNSSGISWTVHWYKMVTFWKILVPKCYRSVNTSQNCRFIAAEEIPPQKMLSKQQAIEAIKDGSWSEKNIIFDSVCTTEPEPESGFFDVRLVFYFPYNVRLEAEEEESNAAQQQAAVQGQNNVIKPQAQVQQQNNNLVVREFHGLIEYSTL